MCYCNPSIKSPQCRSIHCKPRDFIAMDKLPTAVEARNILNKKTAYKLDNAIASITSKINDAIENEQSDIIIEEYLSLALKDLLKSKGYHVEYGSQCDSPYTKIEW